MNFRKQTSKEGVTPTKRVVKAGIAGFLASIPMAVVMLGLQNLLPEHEQYAMPPEEITTVLAARAGAGEHIHDPQTRGAVTWLGHLGYGAAAASAYPLVARKLPLPPVARGMVFGLGVFLLSYMGWLPAANILRPATQMPARRSLIMLVSHLVWGGLIGWFVENKE